jgi:hypothetical protein
MPKNLATTGEPLSAIPVVTTDRSAGQEKMRRSRGLNRSVLEAGQAASDAINAAREQTERFKDELALERVRCGQATDALREFQEHVRLHGAASPLPFTFAMPPDPLTAEILKRDAAIATWSGAYRTVAEAAARDRENFSRDREELLATIAKRDQALEAAALRASQERAAAEASLADARAAVPPDVAAELEALRLSASTYAPRLAHAQEGLGAAERTIEALQKDIHYYVHHSHKATQRELNARRAELEQQAENLRLRSQLTTGDLPAGAVGEQPLPSAPLHQPAIEPAPEEILPLAALEEQLGPAFEGAGDWDLDQRTPQSPSEHFSRSSSATSHASRQRRPLSVSPTPSSNSRGSRRRV